MVDLDVVDMVTESKFDLEALGWALRNVYEDALYNAISDEKNRLDKAIDEEDTDNIKFWSARLSESSTELKKLSEVDGYQFIADLGEALKQAKIGYYGEGDKPEQ
jgi:hypothetical protein